MEGQAASELEEEGATSKEKMGEAEGVTVSISHENLADNLHPHSNKGTAERIHFLGPKDEAKKLKEMALNDITNKLELQSAILKPERTATRVGFGK